MPELRARWPYLALLVAILGLDQLAKALIDRSMEVHESLPIITGLVDLTYVRNRGAAFGILSEADLPYQPVLLGLIGAAALVAIMVYALRLPPQSRLPQLALALIMGGALGNLLDRARYGYVIDFVDVYWGPHHWPAFNVADSAISVGVGLLVLDLLRNPAADPARETDVARASSGGED